MSGIWVIGSAGQFAWPPRAFMAMAAMVSTGSVVALVRPGKDQPLGFGV